MRLPDGNGSQETTEQVSDILELLTRMELLPVEVSEIVLSFLRPADLVSIVSVSSHLELVSQSPRLWRHRIVQLSGSDARFSLRQLELATELAEIQAGFAELSAEAADAISKYQGPIPLVQKLSLSLSVLGTKLGVLLLSRYGPKARQLELDLSHGPLETPRDNIALIELLPDLDNLESLIVRTDTINDIIVLSQLALSLVEIDIRNLRVGDVLRGGPGPAVGAAAAYLISRHACHLQRLHLPWIFDANLCAVVMQCKEIRILTCNVWTLPAIKNLIHLYSVSIHPPDFYVTNQDIVSLMSHACQSRGVLTQLKELRFVGSRRCNLLTPLASPEIAQAIICVLLAICSNLEVIEVGWKIRPNGNGNWTWLDTALTSNLSNLREVWLHGYSLTPRYILSLAEHCPSLQILDLRRSIYQDLSDDVSNDDGVDFTTKDYPGMRRALTLLQEALPELTVLFDDLAKTSYDWNSYLDPQEKSLKDETFLSPVPSTDNSALLNGGNLDNLFLHLRTVNHWTSAGGFFISPNEELAFWRCATLDSALWSRLNFSEILGVAPALGLVDCRNNKVLQPGKKGQQWIKSLANGPTEIRALRLRAILVSDSLWSLVAPILLQIGKSLRCLELDFRGRPMRNWRDVLPVLEALPNLSEFVLKGVFDDQKPVLDRLHGRVCSLTRLDLRDCLMKAKQMSAFVQSLQKLLLELRGTLRAVALPPLPRRLASRVLRTLGELTDLREVALHANELESLRPLTSLRSLEVYGNRRQRNNISMDRVARGCRSLSDNLREIESLTLPADLVESEMVQEAIFDVMPNLRRVHVICKARKLRLCAEGPQCRNFMSKLV